MILASTPPSDKTAPFALLPTDLRDFARQAVLNGSSFHDFEHGLFQRLLALGKTTTDFFLHSQGYGDLGTTTTTANGTILQRSEKTQARTFRSIYGLHTFTAFVYSRGPKQKIELRPIEAFAQDRLLEILRGQVKNVIAGLRRRATMVGLNGADATVIATVCGYFENHAEQMRYHECLAAGYPIATGVIEGACRQVIKDRMEQGGMRWTLQGAEAMLNLRAVNASDAVEAFHQWRQEHGAERVHPHRQLVAGYAGFQA